MVGANPNFHGNGRARPEKQPGALAHVRSPLAALLLCLPLSLLLAQCSQAPNPDALAANAHPAPTQIAASATFDERFPAPQFRDRFPSPSESLVERQMSDFTPKPAAAQAETAPYRVASLEPQVPYRRPGAHDDLTTLVSMKSSAFPYYGSNPASDAPFLNVAKGDRRGHRSLSGQVYWEDETYNDSRVLVHIPENFNVRKPGVIVVFFHGNGATLERDVRDRQLVPRQISDSGVNAVLLAPQMAVDAADSSAGKFWQPGGFRRFIMESADHLARLYGDPGSAKEFAKLPIVIVGYSGGFLPTAWSLDVGGLSDQVRGVVLLDAVYGQLDKFASWIENHRSGFFVSSYTHYTARHDHELMQMLRDKGIKVSEDMDAPLHPGSVLFVETAEGITHRNYVTQAWTKYPIEQVLVKMAAAPALKVASGIPGSASR
ncbi:alpha/beta hydrolase [Bradyrhizobium sp. ARR65]|uniref:alpha/beta hydrolase n=1 Tax=Bradyrhizobium sp. ARR65 TaxID=1040989 RepID=UPI0004667F77|nr:alpha/beta hydrolase [Bradyrhizobium sp. ARR65]